MKRTYILLEMKIYGLGRKFRKIKLEKQSAILKWSGKREKAA